MEAVQRQSAIRWFRRGSGKANDAGYALTHPAPTEPRPLHLLKNSECRFPLTSPERHEPHVFCGSPSIEGKPYCAAHCVLAYRPKGNSK
ncbi:GcrA family cell cycle regulator [Agrobacterium sp. 16-172Ci]